MRINLLHPFLPLAVTILLGCASTQQQLVQTPSGKPEAIFETQDVDSVKSLLVNRMTSSGYSVQNDSKRLLSFTKQMQGMAGVTAQALIGNSYSTTPLAEIAYNFAELDSRIRVVANMSISTQMALGQVKRQDMSGPWFNEIQRLLLDVKFQFESKASESEIKEIKAQNSGVIGIGHNGAGEIVQLVADGPAAKAGLRLKDRILKVDGSPLAAPALERAKQLSGTPGSKVTLVILRGSQEMTFEITRSTRKEP